MASAPVVQNLQDLIGQYTAAQAPQQAQIDNENQVNETSGTAQVAGLDAAKTNAFGGIAQNATNRGMTFSGFTPDQEAKYTGATYLPALAKVQQTIAATRDALLGKKADLATNANTQALGTQKTQQGALDSWNSAEATRQAQEAAAEKDRQFQASENEKNRQAQAAAARTAAAAKAGPSAAELKAQQQASDFQAANGDLHGLTGKDGYVSPDTYHAARSNWINAGYSSASFDSNFGGYKNPQNPYY